MKFEGKKAVVTGGGSGQGASIALSLAREGADVAILDLDLENAEKVANQVRELKRKAIAMKVDVADFQGVNDCIKRVYSEFGRIDFLINSAGRGQYVLLAEMTEEMWDRSVAIHLKGVFNCTRAVINGMSDQQYGRIINISSASGVWGPPKHSHYSAAKAGVIGLTKALAKEVGRLGITVNAIAPGAIDTPFLNVVRAQAPEVVQHLINATLVGRMGRPEEVAALCLYLLSDDAGYITGQVINISGGLIM